MLAYGRVCEELSSIPWCTFGCQRSQELFLFIPHWLLRVQLKSLGLMARASPAKPYLAVPLLLLLVLFEKCVITYYFMRMSVSFCMGARVSHAGVVPSEAR